MSSSVANLLCHLVFSTKKRMPLISESIESELYRYLGGIIRKHNSSLLKIGGTADHLHLLVKLHPDVTVSQMVRFIKANSSKWLKNSFEECQNFSWQTGYGVFSVSQSQASRIEIYIQNQKVHHQKIGFKEELIALLKKHGMSTQTLDFWE